MFVEIGAQESIYERGTNAFFLDRSSQSSLPFVIDDPQVSSKGSNVNELIVDLYSGHKVSTMQKQAIPASGAIIATNFPLKNQQR